MTRGQFRFDRFTLDPVERTLRRDGVVVPLNARYFDALALLVDEAGRLVTKDRFLDAAWRGVPVTDEALTQGIKTLRRALGDDAAAPRFIATVPKHGYRFIAAVTWEDEAASTPPTFAPALVTSDDLPARGRGRRVLLIGAAGTAGAAGAGLAGGLVYGFVAAAAPGGSGVSALLVLLWLTIVVAATGGAGVAFGIAAAGLAERPAWRIVGGAAGGMAIGGLVKLLGLDAFNLLLGRAPGDIAGAVEGLLLGGGVGVGAWLGAGRSLRRAIATAALAGGVGAMLAVASGGRLMAGSLDLLARLFPGSRLRLDPIGRLLGEPGFGHAALLVTGAIEGMLFGACIVGAMLLARRRLDGAAAAETLALARD